MSKRMFDIDQLTEILGAEKNRKTDMLEGLLDQGTAIDTAAVNRISIERRQINHIMQNLKNLSEV